MIWAVWSISHGRHRLRTHEPLQQSAQRITYPRQRHTDQADLSQEQFRIESICPLPYKGKQETGSQYGFCVGQHDTDKGPQCAATVHIGRLFQLLGYVSEELAYHIDIQTVFKAHTPRAHQIIWHHRASQIERRACHCLEDSQYIKEPEMQMQGRGNDLGRNDDHHKHTCKPEFLQRKLKSGKTVAYQRTDCDLQHRDGKGDDQFHVSGKLDLHDY